MFQCELLKLFDGSCDEMFGGENKLHMSVEDQYTQTNLR